MLTEFQTFGVPEVESSARSLHIFLPGIISTNDNTAGFYRDIVKMLGDDFPNSEFQGLNSFISTDILNNPDPDRHITLANNVSKALKMGREVFLYAHSLGASELTITLKYLDLLRSVLLHGNGIDKVHIVLISPAGFGKDVFKTMRMLKDLPKIMFSETVAADYIQGLETLLYLPIKHINSPNGKFVGMDAQAQSDLVSKHFSTFSQLGEFGGGQDIGNLPIVL